MVGLSGYHKILSTRLADSGLKVEKIPCVGITNQRKTTLVWDHQTEEAIYTVIV
jgi:glycerol kinase|tara:strand:+ start:264 stop:425 length:162 start_codon:yes stop_codon:yes gene_type:complete